MKTILYVHIDAYKRVRTLLLLKLASRFLLPTQNYLITVGNNLPSTTQNLLAESANLVVFSFLPPTFVVPVVFTIALTDVQQQSAHFPLETHALLPHGSDYIKLITSRVAALYLFTNCSLFSNTLFEY